MGVPNRTRRNKKKADQFKTFKSRVTRRKNIEKPEVESDEMDKLIEVRTAEFIKVFDRMEREQIDESDAKLIARHATKDGIISYAANQDVDDLANLKVEELTEFEFRNIIQRANRAINVILENRIHRSAGPFYTNRGMRQAAIAITRRKRSIKLRKPTTAKGIAMAMQAKKAAKAALNL